eukprot:403333005
MAEKDPDLVQNLKTIIQTQQKNIDHKVQLLLAIQHNIDYLTEIHAQNQRELWDTSEMNKQLEHENNVLKIQNQGMKIQIDKYKRDSEMLMKEQERIRELISAQENSGLLIETLELAIQQKNDKVTKMDFDLTVVLTEKQAMKKEMDRQDNEIRQYLKDMKELTLKYDLLTDDNSKNLRQNSDYRDLIIGNENKMKLYREEMKEQQRLLEIRDEHIGKLKEEIQGLKDRINVLEDIIEESKMEKEELREENRKMMMGVGLVISDEQLKIKFQTLSNDFEFRRKEWDANENRLLAQLSFSKESNENLKKDYDLLQEKFEAYMRTNNQINDTLKKDFEELNSKYHLCKFQLEDIRNEMDEKIKQETSRAQASELLMKDELDKKDKELVQAQNELTAMKGEINLKLTKLKVMELELAKQRIENEDKLQEQKDLMYQEQRSVGLVSTSQLDLTASNNLQNLDGIIQSKYASNMDVTNILGGNLSQMSVIKERKKKASAMSILSMDRQKDSKLE